jgi:hypothetical protein
VDALARHGLRLERLLHEAHERARSAQVGLRVLEARTCAAHAVGIEKPRRVVEPMDRLEALRVPPGQRVDLLAEDHRGRVAVRIEQPDAPPGRDERALDQTDHRGDAAPAREEQQGPRALVQHEAPERRHHPQQGAGLHLLVKPAGAPAAGYAFHRHLVRLAELGAARERVAAQDALRAERHLEGEVLAGAVAESLAQLGGDRQLEGTRVRSLLHHPRDADLVKAQASPGGGVKPPSSRSAARAKASEVRSSR